MMHKPKKWITVLLIFSFCYLIQLSAMPLQAESGAAAPAAPSMQAGSGTPNVVEEEDDSGYTAKKKKSALPILLAVIGVAAVAALLVLVVFKTKYDIVGTWTVNRTVAGSSVVRTLVFQSGGSVSVSGYIDVGTWTVDGKNATFTTGVTSMNYTYTYTGKFSGKDTMSGNVRYQQGATIEDGTWNATRASTTTGTSTTDKALLTSEREAK
jgi:hypothetical protein